MANYNSGADKSWDWSTLSPADRAVAEKYASAGSSTPAPAPSSNSSSSSSSSYSGGSSSSYAPPPTAVYASAPSSSSSSSSSSNLPQIPSWMGNMYQQVPGTNYYSTNPSNPNSAKYYSDGTPVASVGYSNQQTGTKFDGYATPQQFQQIMGTMGNSTATNNLYENLIKGGQLVSNDSIYKSPSTVLSSTSTSGSPAQTSALNSLTPSQQSAQDWINNPSSGQGGMANYVNTQQQRYNNAVQSGDTDLINRLQADAQRVGYQLTSGNASQGGYGLGPKGTVTKDVNPNASTNFLTDRNWTGFIGGADGGTLNRNVPGTQSGNAYFYNQPYNVDDITSRVTANVNDAIAKQVQAYQQQLATSQQANNDAVTKNNSDLTDQLAKLKDQQTLDQQDAQTLQNRRGGFYSGGLDYQLGSIDRGFAQSQGNLQRDTQQRNQALWTNNADLAKQAADKIALLQQQAPDQIRQQITDELQRIQGNARQDAALTGNYNGTPTLQAQNQQFNQGIAQAGLTGVYNGQQTQQAQNQQFQQGVTQANLTGSYNPYASQIQKMQLNSAAWFNASPEEKARLAAENQAIGAAIGAHQDANGDWVFPQAQPTMAAQQFAYQQARDAIKDQQYQQQFDWNVKQFGLDYALKQATLQNQITNDQAQRAIGFMNANTSRMNAENSANNSNLDNLYKQWAYTGKAPAGIPGVAEGTPYRTQASSSSNNFNLDDYKSYINGNFYKADPNDISGKTKTFDTAGAEKYIVNLWNNGLIDANGAKQLYNFYQIPIK